MVNKSNSVNVDDVKSTIVEAVKQTILKPTYNKIAASSSFVTSEPHKRNYKVHVFPKKDARINSSEQTKQTLTEISP